MTVYVTGVIARGFIPKQSRGMGSDSPATLHLSGRKRTMARIKVGLLGVTHPHSHGHKTTLDLMDEVESVILYDENEKDLVKFRDEFGFKVEDVYTDMDSLLARADVDMIFVALRNEVAGDAIFKAAEAKKHIMAEKPTANNSRTIRRNIEEVNKSGVCMGVCYPWRSHPLCKEIRRLVEEGYLGRIMAMEARMVTSQVKFRDPTHWLFKKSISGGGILSWLGCHWFDQMRFMLQDEVEAVSAIVVTLGCEDIDVEDTASVSLRFRSGALGTMQAGYMLPSSAAGYYGASYDTFITIKGDLGNISWDPQNPEVSLKVESAKDEWKAAPVREFSYTTAQSEAYGSMYGLQFMRQFVRAAITGDVEPPSSGEDALRVMEIVEAAYESSEKGRLVQLPI